MKSYQQIQNTWFFKFYKNVVMQLIHIYYPTKLTNPENIYDGPKSCIYISRHTTHNWELLIGLFAINAVSKKVIRGLGHYLIYILCPWYIPLGVVVGTRDNANKLIQSNEHLFIIPGGGEEMTFGSNNSLKTFWYSKSRKYKTGFAKLAYDNNLPIIPVHGKNTEIMVFAPFIILANYIGLTKLFHYLMVNTKSNNVYKYLFILKMFCSTIFGSILVIPVPKKINMHIGKRIYKKEDEDLETFTRRCESELNLLIQSTT